MPVYNLSRTMTQIPITQGAAGATDLVAIPGTGMKIYVTKIVVVLDAAGSFQFTEGTGPTALTGIIPVVLAGGIVDVGDGISPVLQTNTANSKLTISTVTGKAFGWMRYFIASE